MARGRMSPRTLEIPMLAVWEVRTKIELIECIDGRLQYSTE